MIKDISQLRHWISIMAPRESLPDRFGKRTVTWPILVCRVPAAARDMSAREFYAQAAHMHENVVTFTLRKRDDLTEDMRIIFQDEAYEILQIQHLGYVGQYMELKAKRVKGEGT